MNTIPDMSMPKELTEAVVPLEMYMEGSQLRLKSSGRIVAEVLSYEIQEKKITFFLRPKPESLKSVWITVKMA